jgi:hypothetical protein
MTNQDERYPVAMAMCLSSSRLLPLEENNKLPFPMPILFCLSGDGLLCGFYAVNRTASNAGGQQVTRVPNPNMDGIRHGSIQISVQVKKVPVQVQALVFSV